MGSSNEENIKNEEVTYGGAYKPSIEGKIIEIEDSNTIILEISVEREGYKVGDKVRVKYDKYVECDITSPTGGEKEYLPNIGDVTSVSFWDTEKDSKDGMELIVVDVATKFVTEYSEASYDEGAVQMKVIEGKIVELLGDNIILLEITKERGGFCVGDNVKVEYEKCFEENINSNTSNNNAILPNIGDVVGLQFSGLETDGEEVEKIIVVENIYKYVE
jgi:uncharacterized OB-fold protein